MPSLKQELLEERSERARLKRLCELLEGAAATLEREREIACARGDERQGAAARSVGRRADGES